MMLILQMPVGAAQDVSYDEWKFAGEAKRFVEKSLGTEQPAIDRRVVVNDQAQQGVHDEWEAGGYDMIVFGANADDFLQ